MARLIEFSVRSTKQLQKILAFYDALDQLRDTKAQPRRRMGYKREE